MFAMLVPGPDGKKRCFGNKLGQEYYAKYHDEEWGVAVHDDQHLFEMLILEGAQAGLSWETILRKRDGYRKAFHKFKIKRVAAMTDAELEAVLLNPDVVRNRLKVFGTRTNAQVVLRIQQEFGSLDAYLWSFVPQPVLARRWKAFSEVPTKDAVSDAISKDLKKRGATFVGSTIIYAFMQAVGMVNDHVADCHCSSK